MRKYLLALLALAFVATTAAAQTSKPGPNGGKVMGKGGHQVELLLSPTEMTIYILHDGAPSTVKGAKLRAVVQQGGTNATIQLADVEHKRLVGKLATPLTKGAIVVITGKDDHGDAISARYTID